jgi:hypothetical protein
LIASYNHCDMKLRSNLWKIGLVLVTLTICLGACGVSAERKAIYVGESDPVDFTLSNTKPEIFAFEIPAEAKGPFDFAVELTYFDNQLQGWDMLPLYYALTKPDGKEEDKRFELKLKDEKGGWRGVLQANQTDRIFEENVNQRLMLSPGKYNVKLFGDNKDLSKPILGIVHVVFKVYSF